MMSEEEHRSYIKYKVAKAEETLLAAKVLAEANIWTSVINRLYYACFYAISALLVGTKSNSKTHKSLKNEFNRLFIKPGIISKAGGVLFNALYTQRHRGDYDDFVEFPKEDVVPLINQTELLIVEIKTYLLPDGA